MKKQKIFSTVLFFLIFFQISAIEITRERALSLSRMPLACISQEWPNKTSHMSDSADDHRLLPSEIHPVFFGCLDWHSSVHGHWLLVKILKQFPDIENRDSIVALLNQSFKAEKMLQEADYFSKYTGGKAFERTYGWAWLLKLDEELLLWNDPQAREWHKTLQPLTKTIVKLWKNFLPKQTYPNRTGVHPNTAFGLAFALDYARAVNDKEFEKLIIQKAMDFYAENQKVPAYFEPDGSDFFSPSLLVADLMRRIMTKNDFSKWFDKYLEKRSLDRLMTLAVVSDRTDYQIVHLDGLAFSRAWCMKGIASHLNNKKKALMLQKTANHFIESALPHISHDNYGGSHWLASFALYAMQ